MLHFSLQIFKIVPFWALYLLSDGLAFVLYHVVRYRKKVVFENLRKSFPEMSGAEIAQIARSAYRNLTDVTLETLKSFSLPTAEIERRAMCLNPDLVNQYLDRGQSVILMGSHLGNWEYSGITMPTQFHGTTVTAYKPLSNKKMDLYINEARARTGMKLVPMDDLYREMRKQAGQTSVFVLLSDQSPSSRKSAHWMPFLGRETACLPGGDVLGRKMGLPVLYYRTIRANRRGFYEIEFSELCADPSQAEEMDITRIYCKHLEADIREYPEQWLWSHKRWKMRKLKEEG
jgi:KDO2-lipid IV(A) lauroyltransferase